ncbi:hypothetical protein SAMN05660766_1791 [Curtobacterium sp. 314Chir4.1]|uniref:hypothetical protein n=1 Tax=Curtobacterium sp. 314Chir4.1 TaxID=1279028 RepID=UPI000BD570A6|nr:hypothetical protein [Curtobacterium sp. 314Chir4.1]SOC88095.1 hypothetical protein SAMN05660766_1791 [Curtobacterium sp. 314Chir4.1]
MSSERLESAVSERGREMLGAAYTLLSSERVADEDELIISTCIETLAGGPASTAALLEEVNGVWPGARITAPRLSQSLENGVAAGILIRVDTLTGQDWGLTRAGHDEASMSASWYDDALKRLSEQVQERAADDFGSLRPETALLWAERLIEVFTGTISKIPEIYSGELSRAGAGRIRPVSIDGAEILRRIVEHNFEPGVCDFLQACALAAIDEGDPFGNEVVSYIATSCVLHSVIAGRSRMHDADRASLENQRLLLDTNVLLAFLGPSRNSAHVEGALHLAVQAGMEVIVPTHVLDELADVIERVERESVPGMLQSVQSGISAKIYARTVDEQVLEYFLDAAEERKYSTWEQFARRASRLTSELSSIGVQIRDHGNFEREQVTRIESALKKEIERAGGGRGAKAMERDAESIAMVWRSRLQRGDSSMWPGGWIVTNDRRLGRTFQEVQTTDLEPIVLTPAQLATLLIEAAPAPEVNELVEAAASFARQDAFLRVSVRYPPDTALSLARSLSESPTSETDRRMVQLTVTDMLDGLQGTQPNGESVAGAVVAKRARRMADANASQKKELDSERSRNEAKVQESALQAEGAKVAAQAAQRNHLAAAKERDELQAELDAMNREGADRAILARRKTVRAVLLTLIIASIALFVVLGAWGLAAGTFVGGLIFLKFAHDWVSDVSARGHLLLIALVPELLGLFDLGGR